MSINTLAPQDSEPLTAVEFAPLGHCNERVFAFLAALSKRLLGERQAQLAELVALGFWLRDVQIKKLVANEQHGLFKPIGLVVHFTPANVDTMFVYSWVCSLLMGNNNIVRVASAESAVKAKLIEHLNYLLALPEFVEIAQRNTFVSYAKTAEFSAALSMLADGRVIWGGDASVSTIRSLPTKPRCRDISFADRYSATVINGDALTDDASFTALAALLWRDTHPHQQQACSSPRVIFWLGDSSNQISKQKKLFGKMLDVARAEPTEQQRLNNHLVVSQLIQSTGLATAPIVLDVIAALPVEQIKPEFLDWHLGHGLYLLKNIQHLAQLVEHLPEKLQTLSYWQVDKDKLFKLIQCPSIQGVDRVIPVGHALDFSSRWDGLDLFRSLSRSIVCL